MNSRTNRRPTEVRDRRPWLLTMVVPGFFPCVFALLALLFEGQMDKPLTEEDRSLVTTISYGLIVLVPLWIWAAVSSVQGAAAARRAALERDNP